MSLSFLWSAQVTTKQALQASSGPMYRGISPLPNTEQGFLLTQPLLPPSSAALDPPLAQGKGNKEHPGCSYLLSKCHGLTAACGVGGSMQESRKMFREKLLAWNSEGRSGAVKVSPQLKWGMRQWEALSQNYARNHFQGQVIAGEAAIVPCVHHPHQTLSCPPSVPLPVIMEEKNQPVQ